MNTIEINEASSLEKASVHKKRNSLIELYRFFFAFNVIVGHGLFPIDIPYFGPDRISVEFFFVLSGFLFYGFMKKCKEMSLIGAEREMLASRLRPLLIPTAIGIASNIILNYITNYNPLKIFRYLWYIPAMIITFLLYTALRVLIKDEKKLFITVAIIGVTATAVRFSGSEVLFFFDYARSFSAISIGILLAHMPKIDLKRKWIWWLLLLPVAAATFGVVFFSLAEENVYYEALLDLVLYPLLIFITFNVDFHLSVFDYLGAISFGVYAYQCPARLVANIGVQSKWIPFIMIFALAILDDIIKRIVKESKNKKM